MSFRNSSPVVKALLLGFFCCLGVATAAEGKKEKKAIPVEILSLNKVHPDSDQLTPKIEAGEAIAPPGFKLFEFPVFDDETQKVIGQKHLLVSTQAIVTGKDVEFARPNVINPGEISILLTKEGGEKMGNATRKLQLGRDRLAILLEGRGQIAPTVQAVLGRDFVINGLDGKEEVKRLVEALDAARKDRK